MSVMCVRARSAVGPQPHAGGELGHRKTERPQHRGKEQVLLEAVAAAPPGDELRLQAGEIERDRAAQQDVEILERDVRDVRLVQRVEDVLVRRAPAGVVDPAQVGGQIERVLSALAHRRDQSLMPAPPAPAAA